MSQRDLGTYQMLWDCPFCGTEKLLGVDHRHCPNCGAAQDPARRYFPSEADKVAVENHTYVGTDKACPSCSTPNSAAAKHCVNCGNALDEAKDVSQHAAREASADAGKSLEAAQRAAKQADQQARSAPPPKKGGGGCLKLGCVAAILGLIVVVLVAVFWTREAALQVTGHSWTRSVAIEVYGPTPGEAWCDSMPSGAYDVSRHQEKRSTNKVADGEDCSTKQVDQGDGTFKEVEECKTRYREEPVYDDKCTFKVDKWSKDRSVDASGNDLSPRWPDVALRRAGSCVGCEREGARDATYTLKFKDNKGEARSCTTGEAQWKQVRDGERYKADIGVMSGKVDCDSLKPAR